MKAQIIEERICTNMKKTDIVDIINLMRKILPPSLQRKKRSLRSRKMQVKFVNKRLLDRNGISRAPKRMKTTKNPIETTKDDITEGSNLTLIREFLKKLILKP